MQPTWTVKSYTKSNDSIKTSNDVTLELFRKTVTAGETVILGTNGGQMESANDLVFAIPQADDSLLGDVDKDSAITARELMLTKRIVLANSHSAYLIMPYNFILWLK